MVHIINRLVLLFTLLLAATGAQAQTNPFGAGYSFANGQLFVQSSASLNSLALPFTISFNVIAPTATSSNINAYVSSNPSNSGTGGFVVGIDNLSGNVQSFKLSTYIQPSSAIGSNDCTHSGQMCWRNTFINDGNRHHVCVRWAPTTSYLYLDGIIRDQTTLATFSGPYTTPTDLFWAIGASVPTTATMYDVRAYSSDIGAAGCSALAVAASQGVYPTTGPYSTGMVLHLNMDSTSGICTNVSTAWTCPDTSGFSNTAVNGSLAPTISIATPSPGTVSGTVSTTVSCTLATGTCSEVCYYMDGFLLGACPTTTSPTYAFSWDTTKAIDGTHVLTAVGYSVSGLTTTSAPITVTTSNGVSAITYQFDGVNGSDSNNCISAPCKTSTKFANLTYKGGDTVQFNNATTFTSDSGVPLLLCGTTVAAIGGVFPFGGCTKNFYASSSVFTITSYGSGVCNPLTGSSTSVPAHCARIVANASGSGLRLFNANNVTVQNLALTGGLGPLGIGIDATVLPLGASSGVTIQNNYVDEFGAGGGNIITNAAVTGLFNNNALAGPITNCLIQDNYITNTGVNGSGAGPSASSDTGIGTWAATTCTVQGNLVENVGGNNNSQGNGLDTQNWPNPGGSTTRNIFQFNVTHNNGGTYTAAEGGPYSLYSIGGDYTTFQFNEEYNQQCWTGATGFPACNALTNGPDNGAADIDTGSTHITTQYNYMHGNVETGSNVMLMVSGSRTNVGGNPGWGDNWFRYNIAENYFAGMQYIQSSTPTLAGRQFYNNTLSTNTTATTNGGSYPTSFIGTCIAGPSGTASFLNNICVNVGTTGYAIWYNAQNGGFCGGPNFNAYYAPSLHASGHDGWISNFTYTSTLASWQTDGSGTCFHTLPDLNSVSLTTSPFQGTPNTGGTCWPGGTTPPAGPTNPPSAANCPAVYQLKTGSSLIGIGTTITSTPTPDVTVDYFGNAVPNGVGTGYNIGADGGHH